MALNYDKLFSDIMVLVDAGIQAANPATLLSNHIKIESNTLYLPETTFTLGSGDIYLIAIGKAAVPMAQTALAELGKWVKEGVVVSKSVIGERADFDKLTLQTFQAGHPIPHQGSINAGIALHHLLQQTQNNDLVLCLISGGTSALVVNPLIPLADYQALNKALLHAGCPIGNTNQVRQFFDRLKGGGLAQLAAPALCISLILSDVIGNDLRHIGSGPTVAASKDAGNVATILDKWNVWSGMPASTQKTIRSHLNQPSTTSRLREANQQLSTNTIIGDVTLAAKAVQQKAIDLGFNAHILSTTLEGEAKVIGQMAAKFAKEGKVTAMAGLQTAPQQDCFIFGGETTVTIKGKGYGGRNQELALAAAIELAGVDDVAIISFATDGEDGVAPDGAFPAAGAWVTGGTVVEGGKMGLDAGIYLANNDSYSFFQKLGQGHLTAPQVTNVNDLIIILVQKEKAENYKR